jgi:hypothetical protein
MDLPAFFVLGAESMGLKEKISEDMKLAMKSGERLRLETLRTLRAVLLEKEIERRGSGGGMTPDDESGVLATAAKRRRESIEQFQKGGRADLVDQEMKELAIIQEYLPKQMSPDEVTAVISKVIVEVGAASPADFGKVMPAVMKQVKGKAEGKMVQDLVKKLLGGKE